MLQTADVLRVVFDPRRKRPDIGQLIAQQFDERHTRSMDCPAWQATA